MQTLPIFLKLDGRRCLVVGGGQVAARRVDQLLAAGARVVVAAPELSARVTDLETAGQIEAVREPFSAALLDDCWLVVAATSNHGVNRAVAAAAESARIPCNVVDDPALCSFIMPAIIDREPVTIAISSAGNAPVLVRWIKGLIEETLPDGVATLASLAGAWRQRVREALPDLDARQRFWQRVFAGRVADLAFAGQANAAESALDHALARWLESEDGSPPGQAYLIGAGPGDPELMTLRGRKLLARADVVLYDRLVDPRILEFARRDAELKAVGKAAGKPSIRQEQINRLLVNLVSSGKHVCRLKGGDPMVFGRVREELEALTEAGLPFQIVPGISALSGCAAYAGIPLTVREEARAVMIATGHTTDHDSADLTAWQPGQTLALYMAVANFGAIATRLDELGHPPELPLAVIENGTTARQRVVRSTLGQLQTLAASHGIASPALLLIGHAVRYADRYGWFNPEIVDVGSRDSLAQVI